MASITIRNLDDEIKQRLRVRAAEHGLHVTWAVHNQINNDFVVSNTVDHSVRLNEGLPVFFDAKADQLSGMTCLPSLSGRLGAKACNNVGRRPNLSGSHILQDRPGLAVLGNNQRLALFCEVP